MNGYVVWTSAPRTQKSFNWKNRTAALPLVREHSISAVFEGSMALGSLQGPADSSLELCTGAW